MKWLNLLVVICLLFSTACAVQQETSTTVKEIQFGNAEVTSGAPLQDDRIERKILELEALYAEAEYQLDRKADTKDVAAAVDVLTGQLGDHTPALVKHVLESVVSVSLIDFENELVAPSGSGFFVSPYAVITNYHVVAEFTEPNTYYAEPVPVLLKTHNGAQVVGGVILTGDETSDFAVVGISDFSVASGLSWILDVEFTPLKLDTAPVVGETVFALGMPYGFDHSVSSGIISAVRADSELFPLEVIQTDAPLNPGNSGGPLVSREGRVLGVNTFGFIFSDGLGFAISASELKYFMDGFLPHDVLEFSSEMLQEIARLELKTQLEAEEHESEEDESEEESA